MYRRLDAATRRRAAELVAEGRTYVEVGRILGIDRRTVQRWHAGHMNEDNLEDHARGHRPRGTTAEEEAAILAYARQHVFVTAGQIKEDLGLACSVDIIRW